MLPQLYHDSQSSQTLISAAPAPSKPPGVFDLLRETCPVTTWPSDTPLCLWAFCDLLICKAGGQEHLTPGEPRAGVFVCVLGVSPPAAGVSLGSDLHEKWKSCL